MKTAIVYDRVNKWGGAEKVLLALNELFPDAPLYTSVYSPEKAKWAQVYPEVKCSFINKLEVLRDKHQFLSPLMPLAFESFDFDEYDLVISVTSEYAKGIITKPRTRHICYCLTPTRYLWSGYEEYFKGNIFRYLTHPFVKALKKWDKIAAHRPDVMIAISNEVKKRIKNYYGRDSEVIFPPVDVNMFKTQKLKVKITNQNSKSKNNTQFTDHRSPITDYYLIVSRLESYKKVDLAIEAFIKMNKKLIVVGTGSQENKYKSKYAGFGNIEFRGFIKDPEVKSLMQNAKGFIYPQEEDFGITSVEAQASGCPVIAFKKGGSLDSIIEGKTGTFFEKQNSESITQAVEKFEKMSFDKNDLIKNAGLFNKERFKKAILDLVKKTV